MSFLGESQEAGSRSRLLEPHERYPYMGIYDKGLRIADPALFTSAKPASFSFDHSSSGIKSFDDMSSGTQIKAFGRMELGDISHAMDSDGGRVENEDSFYRSSQMQNDAFETNGRKGATSNPFGQCE